MWWLLHIAVLCMQHEARAVLSCPFLSLLLPSFPSGAASCSPHSPLGLQQLLCSKTAQHLFGNAMRSLQRSHLRAASAGWVSGVSGCRCVCRMSLQRSHTSCRHYSQTRQGAAPPAPLALPGRRLPSRFPDHGRASHLAPRATGLPRAAPCDGTKARDAVWGRNAPHPRQGCGRQQHDQAALCERASPQ
jgi:hypothetical protein